MGEQPAMKATDRPLKPLFSKAASVEMECGEVPVMVRAPARPQSAPEMTMQSTTFFSTLMPANWAASLLRPTARIS